MKFDPTDRVVVKEGWLTKQGGIVKSWKQRWFVLYDNNELCYFKSAYDRVPIDTIYLSRMTLLPSRVNTQIELHVEGRVYQLQAPTMDEAQEWLDYFTQRATEKAKRASTTISASSIPHQQVNYNGGNNNLTSSQSSLPSIFSSFLSPTFSKEQTQTQPSNPSPTTTTNSDQTLIDIKGLMCKHCEDKVYNLMHSTRGVSECNIFADEDRLIIKGNPNVEDILLSLESNGFIVSIPTQ